MFVVVVFLGVRAGNRDTFQLPASHGSDLVLVGGGGVGYSFAVFPSHWTMDGGGDDRLRGW